MPSWIIIFLWFSLREVIFQYFHVLILIYLWSSRSLGIIMIVILTYGMTSLTMFSIWDYLILFCPSLEKTAVWPCLNQLFFLFYCLCENFVIVIQSIFTHESLKLKVPDIFRVLITSMPIIRSRWFIIFFQEYSFDRDNFSL